MYTPIGLLLLVAFTVLAISTAKGPKWKIINIFIILGFMAVGFGIGALLGLWGGNMAIGGEAAVPLAELLGAVGGLGCWRRNTRRNKQVSTPTQEDQKQS